LANLSKFLISSTRLNIAVLTTPFSQNDSQFEKSDNFKRRVPFTKRLFTPLQPLFLIWHGYCNKYFFYGREPERNTAMGGYVIDVDSKVVEIRGAKVLLDCDVAALYGVETREINQAIKNNPDKFPAGYLISLKDNEIRGLRSKILIANSNKSRVLPKAFTEKGLYMLATILKSPQATQTLSP
jgi:hypothetical protein